jgi:hypothetical protein
MTTTKEELLASTLRTQIIHLEQLLQDLTRGPHKTDDILARIEQVESRLHRLRENLTM